MLSTYKSALRNLSVVAVSAIAILGFVYAYQIAHADIDPPGCTATGGSIILTTLRADGVTPVGGGTVTDGELVKYKATLGSLASPVCAFQGGTWTLTTPDGVVHVITPGGGVPRIGGTGVASLDSTLISYTVVHSNEIVDTTRHIDASTLYSGGISHKNSGDSLAGPTLGTSEQTVVVHTPTVATNIHSAAHAVITDAPIGSIVHDNATVTGESGGPAPTGNVVFNLYPNSTCASATTSAEVVALSGNTESSGVVVPNTGLSYKAYYQGNGNYTPAMGLCESLTADKLTPLAVTEIHNDSTHAVVTSVVAGTSVHDKATVGGNGVIPVTGNVEFSWYTNGTCDALAGPVAAAGTVALDGSGIAHPSSTEGPLSIGSYSFKAHYVGDDNYLAADAVCEPLTVTKNSPTIATTLSASSVNVGASVHDSSTLTGATATAGGTVTYTVYTNSACTLGAQSAGVKSVTNGVVQDSDPVAFNTVGTFYWQANYSGDVANNSAVSTCTEEVLTVNKVTPTISTTPNPASGIVGAELNDTATLSGGSSPAGNVTFKLFAPSDGSCSGSAVFTQVDGSAPYATGPGYTSLVAGTYHWTADYAGDANNNPASSGCQAEPVVISQPAAQYCSPGYWKQPQHYKSYVNYSPNSVFNTVFGRNAFPAGMTLVQVLSQGGGGLNAYGRATVGALLNADKLTSGLTPSQVIAKFQVTFDGAPTTGNTNGYYGGANPEFTAPENCPLN